MTSTTSTLPKLRDLDGIEKVFWLMDQNHHTHFSIVAAVTGVTTQDTWREALDRVGRGSPFVNAQILVGPDRHPYFAVTENRGVALQVVQGQTDAWERHVSEELATPFDVAADPLVRGRLLHGPDRSVLILSFHHAVADGTSSAYFLRSVLQAAGGVAVELGADTTSLEQAIDDAGLPVLDGPQGEPDGLAPPGYHRPEGVLASVVGRSLSAEETSALRDRARLEGTTVHAALCAAAARAFMSLRPEHGVSPPRIMSPIDVRRRLTATPGGLGVYVSAVNARIDRPGATLWDDARDFSARLEGAKDTNVLAAGARGVRSLMAGPPSVQETAGIWATVFGAEIMLTNLAMIQLPTTYGDLVLDHVWGPGVSMGLKSEQTIGVITVGGRMQLLHTSYDPAEGMLDLVLATLASALAEPRAA